jgi:hypothetical protein
LHLPHPGDIASAELACGDLDKACAMAGEAAEQLPHTGPVRAVWFDVGETLIDESRG